MKFLWLESDVPCCACLWTSHFVSAMAETMCRRWLFLQSLWLFLLSLLLFFSLVHVSEGAV